MSEIGSFFFFCCWARMEGPKMEGPKSLIVSYMIDTFVTGSAERLLFPLTE